MTVTQIMDWESRYQAGTTAWERPALNPALVSWLDSGVLVPCRILFPGAGRSHEPLALAETGFEVTVLDVAPSAIAAQQARLPPGARAIVADVFEWAPDTPFDAIYEQTCLCALPPEMLPEYENRLAGWLRPGGSLYALFMQSGKTDGPPFDCPIASMRTLFDGERWLWPDELPPLVQHPSLYHEQPAVLIRR